MSQLSLARAARADAFRSSFEEESLKGIEVTQNRLASNVFLGALDEDGELIGAVGLTIDDRIKTRHIATVIALYVVPESAGRGIGRLLLQALIERARSMVGLEQLILTVTDSNAQAKRLYERTGFEVFGIERRAIKVGSRYFDKAHMILFL